MLHEELKNRKNIILLENESINVILYPITKEECKNIIDILSKSNTEEFIDFNHLIDYCGEVSKTINGDLKDIIPIHKTYKNKRYSENGREHIDYTFEYKCHTENKNKVESNNVIIHEDALSSFKCACEKLQTEYFVILKEKKSTYKEFLDKEAKKAINKTLDGNNSNNNNS